MPFCEIAFDGRPVMSSPLKTMRPPVGRSTPVRQLKNVLLPAPFGPMMARTCSRGSSKLTLESAANPPKRIDSCSVLRMGDAAPRPAAAAGEGASCAGSALTFYLGGERASRREDGLVLPDRVEQLELAAFHRVQELAQE